jgi:HTH-type transcriptional regulator/antitoxin HigA
LVIQAEKEVDFFDKKLKNLFTELKHYGFVDNIIARGKEAKIKAILELKKYFGVSDFSSIFAEDNMQVAFRQYHRDVKDDYAVAGWVRTGTREALKRFSAEGGIPEYDMKMFMEKIATLKALSREGQEVFLKRLKVELFECGVLVVYLPGFKNTHIGGALKWIKSHPVIMLKTYKQWEDTFWFNLFHEIGHIVKHSKKDFFMDFGEENVVDEKEKEADTFAKEMLLPSSDMIINDFKSSGTVYLNTITKLENIAKKNNVSVSILAGRLCKDLEKNDEIWKILGRYRKTMDKLVVENL